MYLQTLERHAAAKEQNRRRFPRVKPDELGRIKAEDLSPRGLDDPPQGVIDDLSLDSFHVSSEAPRSRSPWLMAFGGAIAGAVVSAIATFVLVGERSPTVVEARANAPAKGSAIREERKEATGRSAAVANPRHEAPPLRKGPPDAFAAPLPQPVAPPEVKEALVQGDRRDAPPAPAKKVNPVVVMPEREDGAMVPMAGPEGGEDDSVLVVEQ